MNNTPLVIAIDGPAGAGKSTLARALAQRLGITYLDTGATYRALAWVVVTRGGSTGDGAAIAQLARELDIKFGPVTETGQQLWVNGEDVTDRIRTETIAEAASQVSAHPIVREAMVALQRRIAARESVVAEGRDTTTVVFPDATLMVYLDATLEERARRRSFDLVSRGYDVDFEEVRDAIAVRDDRDRDKPVGALTVADNAIIIESTELSIDAVLDRVVDALAARPDSNEPTW